MFLKAPGSLIFLLSLLLALATLYARYVGWNAHFLSGETSQFYALFGAYVLLLLGCTMRGL
jgi:hypothetical protein